MLIKSPLVPERGPQRLDYEAWNQHTSEEHKWELWEGIPFSSDGIQRDRLAICLIFSMGLERMVTDLLPEQSKIELLHLLSKLDENI
ncbi:hypothetical protein [Metabacillus idriensis]|uniref:hypothetical protein n=1 Tax=Metabacillus idriensis TaxID=324768 RepID=UPI00174E4506|nr:hypothetical protein [Metabacillus idriensis]